MFQIKVVEKIKTNILFSATFFRKSCRLWDNVEKCGWAREAADDNMAARYTLIGRATRGQAIASAPAPTVTRARTLMHSPTRAHTNIAFPRQQWFRERASVFCYKYIASLVYSWQLCFGHPCDHAQGVSQYEDQEYNRNVQQSSPTFCPL
jgi:hypothetical protein